MDKEYRQKRSNISMLKKIRQIDKQNLKIGNATEKRAQSADLNGIWEKILIKKIQHKTNYWAKEEILRTLQAKKKKKKFFLTSKDIEGEESAGFRLFYNKSQC